MKSKPKISRYSKLKDKLLEAEQKGFEKALEMLDEDSKLPEYKKNKYILNRAWNNAFLTMLQKVNWMHDKNTFNTNDAIRIAIDEQIAEFRMWLEKVKKHKF